MLILISGINRKIYFRKNNTAFYKSKGFEIDVTFMFKKDKNGLKLKKKYLKNIKGGSGPETSDKANFDNISYFSSILNKISKDIKLSDECINAINAGTFIPSDNNFKNNMQEKINYLNNKKKLVKYLITYNASFHTYFSNILDHHENLSNAKNILEFLKILNKIIEYHHFLTRHTIIEYNRTIKTQNNEYELDNSLTKHIISLTTENLANDINGKIQKKIFLILFSRNNIPILEEHSTSDLTKFKMYLKAYNNATS